jgi:hypothetical protein
MNRLARAIAVFAVLFMPLGAEMPRRILPGCALPFYFTGAGVLALPDNSGPGCLHWTVTYAASGFTGLTLSVQEAPDAGNTPGTFVDWGGTVISGSQPNTATTQAQTVLSGYYRWVQVKLSGLSGSGVVAGTLIGTSNATGGGS